MSNESTARQSLLTKAQHTMRNTTRMDEKSRELKKETVQTVQLSLARASGEFSRHPMSAASFPGAEPGCVGQLPGDREVSHQ